MEKKRLETSSGLILKQSSTISKRELLTDRSDHLSAALRDAVLACASGEQIEVADRSRGRLGRRDLLTEIPSRAAGTDLEVTGRLKLEQSDSHSSVSTR